MLSKDKIIKILDILDVTYPDAKCALDFTNIFELVVAVALSAQTTDKSVNSVTPELFRRYPTPNDLANANQEDVEVILKRIGMYKTKSKNIIELSKKLVSDFAGEVPPDYDKLISLPGVGRKTANVVLSVGFGIPRIAVDTHVYRVANRIGITDEEDVLKTELSLMKKIPEERWIKTHHSLIFHGRNICDAKKPLCDKCSISELCEKKIKK